MPSKGIIVGISAILVGVSAVGGYGVGVAKTRGDTVTQYLLTQDVSVGDPLDGKYAEVKVPKDVSIAVDSLILDESVLKNSIAFTPLKRNQQITKSLIGSVDDQNRNFDFTIPITVEGAIANSLKENEMVAIMVKFKDERDSAVVVPFISVSEIRTSNGEKIADEKSIPGFLRFIVSNKENIDLDNASKEGSLFVVRYNDINKEKLTKTYVKGQKPISQTATDGNTVSVPVTTTTTSGTTTTDTTVTAGEGVTVTNTPVETPKATE